MVIVMTAFAPNAEMTFGGCDEPSLFLQLKSIGLPDTKTKNLSNKFACLAVEKLEIAKDRLSRIYGCSERFLGLEWYFVLV